MKDFSATRGQEYTLNQFVEAIRGEIESGAPAMQDGRVAEFPDARTIRYYQSIGVLDKPLGYDGRIAIYGQRHLVQVLAIKALQSQGYSLAQIQRALLSTTSSELETLVGTTFRRGRSRGDDEQIIAAQGPRPFAAPKEEIADKPRDFEEGALDLGLSARGAQKELIAFEVGPGITVLLDPERVQDPEGTIEQIRKSLKENKQ